MPAAKADAPLIADPLDAIDNAPDGMGDDGDGGEQTINADEIPTLSPREARTVGRSLIEDVPMPPPPDPRLLLPDEDLSKHPARWPKEKVIAVLAAYTKVPVYIPKEQWELDNPNAVEFVGYQGWGFLIPKGEQKLVPMPIFEILQQAQQPLRTEQAKNRSHFIVPLRDDGDWGAEIKTE